MDSSFGREVAKTMIVGLVLFGLVVLLVGVGCGYLAGRFL